MFFSADMLVAHAVGDYLLQTDRQAARKTRPGPEGWRAALAHALSYSVPFVLLLEPSLLAWLVIVWTHALIDHYRLARYLCWVKEWLDPACWVGEHRPPPLADCPYGFAPGKPDYLAVWLFILADNLLHVLINAVALRWL